MVDIESKSFQSCTILRSKIGPMTHMGLENLNTCVEESITKVNPHLLSQTLTPNSCSWNPNKSYPINVNRTSTSLVKTSTFKSLIESHIDKIKSS